MNHRRQLRADDKTAAGAASSNAQSQLLLDEAARAAGANGENPCVSNDNPRPYHWNCTDVPTSSPIGNGTGGASASANGGLSSGSGSVSGSGSGSDGGGANLENDTFNQAQAATSASYTYKCTSNQNQYCNSHSPGNSLGLGWTLTGTCDYQDTFSLGAMLLCPPTFDPTKAQSDGYVEGDAVMISSDELNGRVVGSVSCPSSSSATTNTSTKENGSNEAAREDADIVVPFVYEVETSQVSSANIFLPRLEEQILLNLADRMMDCFVSGGEDEDADVGEGDEGGSRSFLLRRRRLNSAYAVKGILSHPQDVAVTEGPCTISNAEADNCFIIDGRLTVVLDNNAAAVNNPLATTRSSSSSNEASILVTSAAQSNLEEAMTNDDLLSPNYMPEVHKVTYLGDSYTSYLANYQAEEGLLATNTGGGTLSGTDGAQGDGTSGGEAGGGGMPWLAMMLGGVFGAFMVMMCALLFVRRRRVANSAENKQRAEAARGFSGDCSQAVGGDFDWEDWDESVDGAAGGRSRSRQRLASLSNNGEVVLHVNNLSSTTTEDDVRELFEQHGVVNNCIVPLDHGGGAVNGGRDWAAKRCALLTMPATNDAEVAEAESACHHMNGLEVDRHELQVQEVTTLYVGNLSPDTSEEDVYQLFSRYGTVTGCSIPSDHDEGGNTLGSGERFALVTMPTDDAAKAIKYIHGTKVHRNVLSVQDIKHMNGGRGIPGGGLAAAALAAGVTGAMAAFHQGLFNGGQGNDELTLHVGNLSPDTTTNDIRQIFEEHGTVTQCSVPNNSRGERFALVTMPAKEAEKACNYVNGIEVDGYQLNVQHAQQVGFGRGAMSRRNLMDEDASSANDNSYTIRDSRRRKKNGEDGHEVPGVLTTLGAIGGFVAAPFLLKPCRKKSKKDESLAHLESITGRSYGQSPDTDQSLDDGLDNIIRNIDGATDAHDKRNFVVDPPNAFHLGNHHYTADGVRYFSPLCEQCVAARADEDGVLALAAIHDEDEEEESTGAGGRGLSSTDLSFDLEAATKFTDFNSNDLGRYHSSMHVRHCKSTTCNICQREKGVFFVKARKEL